MRSLSFLAARSGHELFPSEQRHPPRRRLQSRNGLLERNDFLFVRGPTRADANGDVLLVRALLEFQLELLRDLRVLGVGKVDEDLVGRRLREQGNARLRASGLHARGVLVRAASDLEVKVVGEERLELRTEQPSLREHGANSAPHFVPPQ